MRLIDADVLEKYMSDAEIEATRKRKYVFASALNTIRGNIRNFPTIEPEPQWIPCSERLPEDYENVLVYFEYYRYGDYNCMFSTYGIGSYSSEYDSWLVNGETGWRKLYVFAWSPLPEPYKEDEE